jgi:mono/diheme cytochrome c family protein
MRLRCGIFALLLGATVALAGCDALFRRSPGEKVWRQHCAKCHGLNGAGNTPGFMGDVYADLTDDLWREGGSDGAMGVVIGRGVFGKMPGYPQLTPEEVRAVIDHVRVLRGERAAGTSG